MTIEYGLNQQELVILCAMAETPNNRVTEPDLRTRCRMMGLVIPPRDLVKAGTMLKKIGLVSFASELNTSEGKFIRTWTLSKSGREYIERNIKKG